MVLFLHGREALGKVGYSRSNAGYKRGRGLGSYLKIRRDREERLNSVVGTEGRRWEGV